MKTAIVYMSKHGTTEKVVKVILEHIKSQNTEVFNLRNDEKPDLGKYDLVIIGGSIHAGMVQKKVKQFYANYSNILLNKKVGLFLCCMEIGQKANEQFNNAFPEELRQHAFYTGLMGGECLTDKMNFFERTLVKLVVGGPEKYPKLNQNEINTFLKELDEFIPGLN
jgi:menaquinone-dependent protoporphyrinogen oxidase